MLGVRAAGSPSPVVVVVGVVVHLRARQRVDGGRGQGDVGPVGAVGFGGFGTRLGFLLLASSFPTFGGETTRRGFNKPKNEIQKDIKHALRINQLVRRVSMPCLCVCV